MMRSLSEMKIEPLHLQEGVLRSERKVSRLEFRNTRFAEEPVVERVSDPAANPLQSGMGEVEKVREELRLQEEQFEQEIEEARRESADAARTRCLEEFALKQAAERERITRLCTQLERERVQYFVSAEAEVVKLALAIAAQVLHREVKLDPLLLRGVVRVALEKIRDAGSAELRVPNEDLDAWRETLAGTRELMLNVVGDEHLTRGEFVLESNVGRADLGIQAQLEEIERGFFDLLEKRPA